MAVTRLQSQPYSKKELAMFRVPSVLIAIAAIASCSLASAQAPKPGYHVIKKFSLPGEGGWDYLTVDSDAHRLYIGRSDRVQVVDLEKETLAGEVAPTPGVHGAAIVAKLGRGVCSNGGDGTATIFDLASLKER